MAEESIIRKIKALRAKANNAASTPAEVEAAAKLVARMMMEHDVQETQLEDRPDIKAIHARMPFETVYRSVALDYWNKALERFTQTKFYVSTTKSKKGTAYGPNFVGTPHDVEMAMYLFEMVGGSMDRGWLRFVAETFDNGGFKPDRFAYYIGFAETIAVMLDKLYEERMAAQRVNKGTALVVAKNALINNKLAEMGISLRAGRGSGSRSLDRNSYNRGGLDGQNVNLNRPFGDTRVKEGLIR